MQTELVVKINSTSRRLEAEAIKLDGRKKLARSGNKTAVQSTPKINSFFQLVPSPHRTIWRPPSRDGRSSIQLKVQTLSSRPSQPIIKARGFTCNHYCGGGGGESSARRPCRVASEQNGRAVCRQHNWNLLAFASTDQPASQPTRLKTHSSEGKRLAC